MLTGTLVLESLEPGSTLDTSDLTFTSLRCVRIGEPAPGQPDRWVLGAFTSDRAEPDALATRLAGVLDRPGWYADFHDATWHWVVYSGRVFRYRRDDPAGRDAAVRHGRDLGVPEGQLDWDD